MPLDKPSAERSSTRSTAILSLAIAAAALGARTAIRVTRREPLIGRTVLVTGGSRGLGLVLARQLVRRGARVAICGRDPDTLRRALHDLQSLSTDVLATEADISTPAGVERAVRETRNRFGLIDVLINNVATIQVGPAQLMTEQDYREAMDQIFWTSYRMTQAVLPDLRGRGGRVANIASVGGLIPPPHLAPYVAAKHALVGWSRAMHNELKQDDIHVTTVNPGLMRTGSPRNIVVRGNAEAEYAWFKLGDSLPFTSMSADRAARAILNAIERRDAEVTLTLSAKLGARVQSIFPNVSAAFGAMLNGLLPQPVGSPEVRHRGRDVESAATQNIATALTDQAARRNNEFN